jgi:hypothetical protein
VFIHEYSHALACWLTGGNVKAIRVFDNEGGIPMYVGGCRCLIIPAGYVECSFFAMIFVRAIVFLQWQDSVSEIICELVGLDEREMVESSVLYQKDRSRGL